MQDLQVISERARTIYFSVDAMSPKYLKTLAAAMADSPHRLRWSAELRLERTFPKRGTAELLARSGCVAISFGFESASQRVLDLIDKGVLISGVAALLEDLAGQGIGAQMMAFTGFPTESAAEARETYSYLVSHRDLWSLAGVGRFVLTSGSIIAKQPARFGIDLLPLPATEDIQRFLPWQEKATGQKHWPADADDRVSPELRSGILRGVNGRPFVGGIDSGHSLLYFAEFGRDLLPKDTAGDPVVRLVREGWLTIPFANLTQFTSPGDMEETYRRLLRGAQGVSYDAMKCWRESPGEARRGSSAIVVLPSGTPVGLPAEADSIPQQSLAQMVRILGRARGAA
jgi:hypothetical protein